MSSTSSLSSPIFPSQLSQQDCDRNTFVTKVRHAQAAIESIANLSDDCRKWVLDGLANRVGLQTLIAQLDTEVFNFKPVEQPKPKAKVRREREWDKDSQPDADAVKHLRLQSAREPEQKKPEDTILVPRTPSPVLEVETQEDEFTPPPPPTSVSSSSSSPSGSVSMGCCSSSSSSSASSQSTSSQTSSISSTEDQYNSESSETRSPLLWRTRKRFVPSPSRKPVIDLTNSQGQASESQITLPPAVVTHTIKDPQTGELFQTTEGLAQGSYGQRPEEE